MSIISMVKDIKQVYKEYIILVKIGKFYYCYGKDAYIISALTNYKLNILENNIYSSAFSTNAYNKVINILEEKKINYLILDRRNNYEESDKQNFKNLNTYNENFKKAKENISTKVRIEKIYKFLIENSKNSELLTNIENIIADSYKKP